MPDNKKIRVKVKKKNKPSVVTYKDRYPSTAMPQLVHKLRELSFGINMGDNWITALSDQRLIDLYFMLKAGTSLTDAVEVAVKEWNAVLPNTTSSAAVLGRFLRKLESSSVLFFLAATEEEKKIRASFMRRARHAFAKFDAIKALSDVCVEQERRVHEMIDAELVTGKRDPLLTGEIVQYTNILERYIKLAQSLGFLDDAGRKDFLKLNEVFQKNVVDTFISDASAEDRMLEISKRFLGKIDSCAIDCVRNDDGSYEVTNS